MSRSHASLSIGAVAEAAGVNVETIRFYQRRGLLAEPARRYGEMRRYGSEAVARVRFIKAAQRLGFSLHEVAGLLKLEDGTRCDEARVMAEQKLADVRGKLRDLRRMESVLKQLVADCCARRGTIACPLIAALRSKGISSARSSAERRSP